jgi:hypothetical protein
MTYIEQDVMDRIYKRNCEQSKEIERLRANEKVLVDKLEDMKHSDMSTKNGLYCAGYNEAIKHIQQALAQVKK